MSYSYQVYVGNLATSITTEQLKDLFSQVGQVLNVWINRSNQKITYGFVEFDNIISAEDACKKFNEIRLDFSHITVRISERTKNQSKLKIKTAYTTNDNGNGNENDNERYNVYVGNLSTTITEEQLKDLFSQAGQVLHVWINPDHLKITYGFVKFDNLISAQNACKQFNGLELDNEYIIVRISKDEQKHGTKLKIKNDQTTNDNEQVYVGNLSTTITEEQLKDLFSQVGQVLHVWINPDHLKITYGFVKFDNLISAQNACKQFNGLELDNEYIIVRISKDEQKHGTKLKIKNDQTTNDNEQVYVGNLSTTITKEQLEDLFSQVGQVLRVWINPEHLKITYGFVTFDSLISAQNACKQFNGLKLDSEYITVRINKPKNDTKDYLPQRCGILLELPKKKKPSQEFLLKKALAKDLRQNRELGADFVNACIEMEQLTFDDKPEMIKTAPEEVNLDTIAQTIKRYYKPPLKKHNWEVDIDLSKGKLLTAQEYDKFFNLKLSKTLLRKPIPEKKEKHYSLDYRSVNN